MLKNLKIQPNTLLMTEVVVFSLAALGVRWLLNAAAAAFGFPPALTVVLGFVLLAGLIVGANYADKALTRFLQGRGYLK